MLVLLLASCIRPTATYDVGLYDEGLLLDEALARPVPRSGQIEVARMAFHGTNLGYGLTHLLGDTERADGRTVVTGSASFGYPPTADYDRNSVFLAAGPPGPDRCFTRDVVAPQVGAYEYADAGDHVGMAGDGVEIRLERDPAAHPRPAGESWYAGYGGTLLPAVEGHDLLPDTWRSDAVLDLTFPGTLAPVEATLGSIPFPLEGQTLILPPAIEDLRVNGDPVRPPQHGPSADDDVRFAAPFYGPMTVTWTPSPQGSPLTIAVRYLGWGVDADCDCSHDCPAGFTCEFGACAFDEGSGWAPLGEVVCTAEDDGEFTLTYADVADLDTRVPWWALGGVVLVVARIEEGTVRVPDILTYNGGRAPTELVRTRAMDVIFTRLSLE